MGALSNGTIVAKYKGPLSGVPRIEAHSLCKYRPHLEHGSSSVPPLIEHACAVLGRTDGKSRRLAIHAKCEHNVFRCLKDGWMRVSVCYHDLPQGVRIDSSSPVELRSGENEVDAPGVAADSRVGAHARPASKKHSGRSHQVGFRIFRRM